MKVYIFENNYYIGIDENVISMALSVENVELEDAESIVVENGVLSVVKGGDDVEL